MPSAVRCVSVILGMHDAIIKALAVIAGALLVFMFAIIIYDVTIRSMGWGVPVWAVNTTEYALVYVTFLGAPWLLRQNGHVFIQSVTGLLSPRLKWWTEKLVCLICGVMCLMLAYRAGAVTVESFGEIEITAFEAPRWLRYWTMPIGFLFLAIEFVRFLFSQDSLYGADQGEL